MLTSSGQFQVPARPAVLGRLSHRIGTNTLEHLIRDLIPKRGAPREQHPEQTAEPHRSRRFGGDAAGPDVESPTQAGSVSEPQGVFGTFRHTTDDAAAFPRLSGPGIAISGCRRSCTLPVRNSRRPFAGAHAQFAQDARDVDACSLHADDQGSGDLAVGLASDETHQHLAFSSGRGLDQPRPTASARWSLLR
jgi:hypothetical protein